MATPNSHPPAYTHLTYGSEAMELAPGESNLITLIQGLEREQEERILGLGLARRAWKMKYPVLAVGSGGEEIDGMMYGGRPGPEMCRIQRPNGNVWTGPWSGLDRFEIVAAPPKVDRRLRTAPHGDALVTRVMPSAIRVLAEMDSLLLERGREFLAVDPATEPPGMVSIGPSSWVRDRWWRESRGFAPRFPPLPWWNTAGNVAGGRLTPGSLKLAGARIMAAHKGTDVADEMAAQIDFEWEERRWRVPAGDAAAAENGMGC